MSIQGYTQLAGPDPVVSTDLATKRYMDAQLSNALTQSGEIVHEMAKYTMNWGSTASTTFVPVTNGSTNNSPFTKWYAGTNLRCQLGMSGYVSPAGYSIVWGISPTNNASDIVQFPGNASYNVASTHQGYTFIMDIAGRAAGNYNFTVYVHGNGATCYGDGNDNFWYRVQEVWP